MLLRTVAVCATTARRGAPRPIGNESMTPDD